ncbi:hypothetical protein KY308_00245, partial [Candidatus Woesearchaeota archaeon]|nr:hypothetical protein [Candidatus Woesearchaeota archaeon]
QKKYQEVLRKEGKTIETQLEELRGNQTFDEFTAEWQKLLTELNANNESFLKFVEPREKAIRAKTLAASRAAKRKNLTELKDVLSSEMSYLGTVSKHFNNLMRIVAEFKSVIKDYDLNRKFSGKVNDEIADDLQDFVGEVGDFSDETIALVNSCIKGLDMKDPVHRQIYDLLLNHLDNILAELSNLNKNLKPFGKSLDKQINKINQYKQSILNMSLRQ